MRWKCLSIPKLQRLHRGNLEMDKYLLTHLIMDVIHLSMPGLVLIHVSNRCVSFRDRSADFPWSIVRDSASRPSTVGLEKTGRFRDITGRTYKPYCIFYHISAKYVIVIWYCSTFYHVGVAIVVFVSLSCYIDIVLNRVALYLSYNIHDDVIKWKHFPRYWPFVREFTGLGEFPSQRPVTRSFDVSFDLRLNTRLCKQSWGWWFETPSRLLWRHRNDMEAIPTLLGKHANHVAFSIISQLNM